MTAFSDSNRDASRYSRYHCGGASGWRAAWVFFPMMLILFAIFGLGLGRWHGFSFFPFWFIFLIPLMFIGSGHRKRYRARFDDIEHEQNTTHPSGMVQFCQECGSRIATNDLYCSSCGSKLG